jgi:hypothetical protein
LGQPQYLDFYDESPSFQVPPGSQVKGKKDMPALQRKTYPGKYHGYDPITFIKREAVIHSRREDKEISRLDR